MAVSQAHVELSARVILALMAPVKIKSWRFAHNKGECTMLAPGPLDREGNSGVNHPLVETVKSNIESRLEEGSVLVVDLADMTRDSEIVVKVGEVGPNDEPVISYFSVGLGNSGEIEVRSIELPTPALPPTPQSPQLASVQTVATHAIA